MKHWFVLITKPRFEKKVAERLRKMNIQVFLPTKVEHKKWSDRIKKVESPFLPSTVFVQTSNTDRNNVFNVPGVVRYLFWLGKPAEVTEEEIETLKEVCTDNVQLESVETLKKGDEIEVNNLGSTPQEGVLKKVSGNTCWITLKRLGYVIKIKV